MLEYMRAYFAFVGQPLSILRSIDNPNCFVLYRLDWHFLEGG